MKGLSASIFVITLVIAIIFLFFALEKSWTPKCTSDQDCNSDECCYTSKYCAMTPNGMACSGEQGDQSCHKLCNSSSDCSAGYCCKDVIMYNSSSSRIIDMCTRCIPPEMPPSAAAQNP
jgi:hypothetical protein